MLALTKYFLRTGIFLVIAGLCSAAAGGVRLYYYFAASPLTAAPTLRQSLRWVVVPHIAVALGLGLIVIGGILIGKGVHFHFNLERADELRNTRNTRKQEPDKQQVTPSIPFAGRCTK